MHKETLVKAIAMAIKMGHVLIATADSTGVPHISVLQPLGLDSVGRLKLIGWFCQYTAANLEMNPRVSVVVWDPLKDTGYQLIGAMEEMKEVAMLDGYAARIEKAHPLPQVERVIHLRMDKILGFEKRPHIDVEV